MEDLELSAIRNLVNINNTELQTIIKHLYADPNRIQLLDYINYLDLSSSILEHTQNYKKQIAESERLYHKIMENVLLSSRTLEKKLTSLRINPNTFFSKSPALFFGIGCGNKSLCQGMPFDVLTMVLTGEKLRRELKLSKCQILIANRHNSPNSQYINNIAQAKKELLQIIVDKFGFTPYWQIFLQTDIENIIGEDTTPKYIELIAEGNKTDLIGGKYYANEMADIWALVGKDIGGIKLGWFMQNLDKKNASYIMDEQPFHARYVLFMALQNMKNTVTFAYVKAGAKLYPGLRGTLEKESPYICYSPSNRLLLSPFERIFSKIQIATENKGGMQFKYYRNLISGITNLFEELVLGKNQLGQINRIPTSLVYKFKGSRLAEKAQFVHDYIFSSVPEAYRIWLLGFPNSF